MCLNHIALFATLASLVKAWPPPKRHQKQQQRQPTWKGGRIIDASIRHFSRRAVAEGQDLKEPGA